MSARIVLVCEDTPTDSFVRRFLRSRQFKARDIRTLPLPHGSQSAEQWVRAKYPDQLKAIRSRQDAFLIVVIDADRHTTQQRRSQLDEECRTPLPTDGESIDETLEYRAWKSKNPRPLADKLYRMCHEDQDLRRPSPTSLEESCKEYRKLQR